MANRLTKFKLPTETPAVETKGTTLWTPALRIRDLHAGPSCKQQSEVVGSSVLQTAMREDMDSMLNQVRSFVFKTDEALKAAQRLGRDGAGQLETTALREIRYCPCKEGASSAEAACTGV
jgi:hypothetical protein